MQSLYVLKNNFFTMKFPLMIITNPVHNMDHITDYVTKDG